MRREQSVVIVMLAILLAIFAFESYLLWYGREHHGVIARFHDFMSPGLLGAGWSLLLAVLVGFVLFYYVSRINSRDEAINVLKTRYAKGEISREDYLRMLKDMMHED